jgi:DNA-binding NarL/FixJ family response regulator
MVYVVKTKVVLSAGLGPESKGLTELPLQLVCCDSAERVVAQLRQLGVIDLFISSWDLPDMRDGDLVRLVKDVRPWLRTVVLVDDLKPEREIAARRLGVTAVFSGDVTEDLLREAVARLLSLEPSPEGFEKTTAPEWKAAS